MGALTVDVSDVHRDGKQAYNGVVVLAREGEFQIPMITEKLRVGSTVQFKDDQIFNCVTR